MDKIILEQELKKLAPDKLKIIKSNKRFLRIIAGAGAGKTTTLAMRIVHLLSKGVKPEEIVAFTFTEKAAQNMKSKIYEKVEKIDPELCNFLGDMYIGTIHAFCFQLLEDNFKYGNYGVLDENQEIAFLLRFGWDLGLGLNGNYTKNCTQFIKSISAVYDEMIPLQKLKEKSPDFMKQFLNYEKLLESHKLLTFPRMINLLVRKLEENKSSLKKIKYLIVDEYQDVNKAQQKLISMAGEKSSVYVVGDPRQCIYQWRGSNKDYFDNFLEIFPDSESVMISENFRSASKIVENANKFSQTLEGNYENMKSFRSDSGEVLKVEFNDNEKEAENIVKEIKRLVEIEKKCSYSDISILFRSVKTSARPFIEVMKKLGIPYIVGGKIGLFKRDEAQVVGRLFAWLSEEGFWIKDIYNWKNSLKKDDLLESVKELLHNTFPTRDFPEKKLKEWKKEVLDGSYNDLTDAFHELLLILGYLKFDQEKKLDAAVMANLGRFNSLLIDFQSSVLIGGRRFNWKKDLKGLVWFMNAYASEAYEEQMPDDIRGIDAVQIMTIHQAKGLEWLVVFMPSLTNQRFPSRNIGREQNWFLSRDLFPVKRYEGDEDDERRLFYVAMTRARDNLIFSYFKFIKNPMKESPFLKDLKLNSVINNEKIEIANMEKHENEEEIQTFSGGEILGYNRCHYFYRLNCLWNYPSTFSPRLNFGKSLHHCLRRASELIKEESMEPKKAIEKVFEEGEFYLPYASKLQREVMTKYAKRSLLKYADKNKNDLLNVDEVEARIEFPLEKATIAGRVDVIIGPKGNLEVRDYKTSDTIITNEEASLQVQIYTLGLGLVNKNIKKASIAYIKEREGKVPIEKVGISKTDLEKAKKKAKDAIDGIKKGKWKARSSKHCDKCAYKKICRYTTCKRKTVLKFGGKNE